MRSISGVAVPPQWVGALVTTMAVAACAAGGASNASDKTTVVVPPQPPPVAPQPSPPSSNVSATPGSPPTPAFKCDSPGKRFEVGGRSYCAYSDPDSWESAERRCVDNGGHLMTLDSPATSDGVHKALGSPHGAGRAAWIGLELKTKGKKDWKWISGEALSASSWNTGEPNNFDGNERCAEWLVVDGRWNDTRCELRQPFLCQAKGNDKPLSCANGRAFSVNGSAYCLNMANRTFSDAKNGCEAIKANLAVLKTSEENEAVRDALAQRFAAKRMWIGLNDANAEGEFTWISGAPVDFQVWHAGEPNNFNGENCVELFADTWTWNDLDCGVKLPSVCESPVKKR